MWPTAPMENRLATGGWDNTVKLHDAATGENVLTIFAHDGFVLDLAFSPDSRQIVTTSEDRSVRLWNVSSGRKEATFQGHTDFVQVVAFRPDGQEFATGSLDGSVRFWDLNTSSPIVMRNDWPVDRVAYRRDGLRVLSKTGQYGPVPGLVRGWNPLTGETDSDLAEIDFNSLPEEFIRGSNFTHEGFSVTSPDGKLIAQNIKHQNFGGADRSKNYAHSAVVVRDSRSGRILHTLIGHSADVVSVVFSPDSRRLATASFDRTIKLWDTQTGQDVFTLGGHTAGLLCLAFSPDGNQIVSGGYDATARVWNATPLESKIIAEHDARYQRKINDLANLKDTLDGDL